MNKTELVDRIAAISGLSKTDSKKALDATFEAVQEALEKRDKIALIGFGTFMTSERPERKGINLRTKEPITIPAKTVVKFKPGQALDSAVNK